MNRSASNGYTYMNRERKIFSSGMQIIHGESVEEARAFPRALFTDALAFITLQTYVEC